ncbi:MAG TPA: hypothetical protein VJ691_02810 [Vicinamibacterales bacterium]|nr:hypothetical protein [Vicinamibacterales bacterium]
MIRLLLALCVAVAQVATQPAPSVITTARISPDGQSIAFARQSADRVPLGLFKITIAGQDEMQVAPPDGVVSDVTWSPAADAIAYVSRPSTDAAARVRVVPATGGAPQTIDPSTPPFPLLPKPLAPPEPIVDVPDAQILFITPVGADRQALTLSNGKETWIVLASTTGTRLTVMRPGVARIVEPPSWSDDGKWFAVLASPRAGEHPEIFAGSLPRPQPKGINVGAAPPMVRQLTGVKP